MSAADSVLVANAAFTTTSPSLAAVPAVSMSNEPAVSPVAWNVSVPVPTSTSNASVPTPT